MGYAIPGSVIAVGILIPLAQVEGAISPLLQNWFNLPGSFLQGTITALIFAYLVRFLAVSLGSVESGLAKIKPSFDDAAHSLGHSARSTLAKVHAPMMGGSLLTALMLVFVDVMKELPATIVIQPPNFDTLAVRVYRYAVGRTVSGSGSSCFGHRVGGAIAGHFSQLANCSIPPTVHRLNRLRRVRSLVGTIILILDIVAALWS